ncbi:MAG: ferrous iron transport protein B [Candidatus Limiplasma sp.]|nr:ferrous iron transport protein B [Candidatus Limiplasma sp.]
MRYTFALAGNQNSGKTTLFNQLTGSSQHVGNWPGVTVEQKTGTMLHHHHGKQTHLGLPFWHAKGRKGTDRQLPEKYSDVTVVDLPGIYSLSPYSMEEVISRNFILREKPDLVINIVDATNLERNLYLTLQLLQLGRPVVIALNMMDEIRSQGDVIDLRAMEKALGVPVVAISARKGEGLDELVRRSMDVAQYRQLPAKLDICQGAAHKALHAVAHLVEHSAMAKDITPLYAATKLFEGDEPMLKELELPKETEHIIEEILCAMEKEVGMERAAVMADTRYRFLEGMLASCVTRNPNAPGNLSDRIDGVLTHRLLAIPVFLVMMLSVFFITFGPFGAMVADWFSGLVDGGIQLLGGALEGWGVAPWVRELLVKGVLTGVGSVLSFMPTILILFLLLSILEDSGYMARAAFLMDKPLRALGLNGRSFIPMMMGFGCSVPAIMSARSMNTQRDRRFTIMLTPFMSCGAKVPIYALFTAAFFPENQVVVMSGLYITGILMSIAAGLLLKRFVFHGDASPFIMELPSYRLPTPRNVGRQMWDKAKDFIHRAFTVIFLATLVVWFLQSFTFRLTQAQSIQESMLGSIAGFIAPVFTPAGFGNVQAATAVLTGIMAKESVVSTLAVLSGAQADSAQLLANLHSIFPGTLSAISFLLFVLLYMPCVAAFAAMRREMESLRWAFWTVAGQTALAWVIATLVYQGGMLLGLG